MLSGVCACGFSSGGRMLRGAGDGGCRMEGDSERKARAAKASGGGKKTAWERARRRRGGGDGVQGEGRSRREPSFPPRTTRGRARPRRAMERICKCCERECECESRGEASGDWLVRSRDVVSPRTPRLWLLCARVGNGAGERGKKGWSLMSRVSATKGWERKADEVGGPRLSTLPPRVVPHRRRLPSSTDAFLEDAEVEVERSGAE